MIVRFGARELWNATHNCGAEYRGVDGLSGPYVVPEGGYEISFSRRTPKGFWSETHGISEAEFHRKFTVVDSGPNKFLPPLAPQENE